MLSKISYAPHHVFLVSADEQCRRAWTYGAYIRPLWLRATCDADGKAAVAFGEPRTADAVEFTS
jgi:hypothetical protein